MGREPRKDKRSLLRSDICERQMEERLDGSLARPMWSPPAPPFRERSSQFPRNGAPLVSLSCSFNARELPDRGMAWMHTQ